ncbi:MAG: hypothetical protein IKH03_02385 [Oscillospiraceae bacterium]|nr:hypothetical protein [Oscillospiraceae bacterium]
MQKRNDGQSCAGTATPMREAGTMTRMSVEFWLDQQQMEQVKAIAAEIGEVTPEKAFEFIMLTGSRYVIDQNIAAFARLTRHTTAARPRRDAEGSVLLQKGARRGRKPTTYFGQVDGAAGTLRVRRA